jgi:predicted RNA-binding Zn ribbon-like protein
MRLDHGHEATLDDSLDFINTLHFESDEVGSGTHDHLGQPGAGVEWLAQRGLVHRPRHGDEPSAEDARARAKIGRCRDAMRELFDATVERRPIRREALAEVNRVLRHREVIELVAGESGPRLDHRHVGDPVDDALARLAEALAREVGTDDTSRLRICANDTCRWAFRDSSPTGRRRWCDMSSCGNRAKAARHRARLRAAARPISKVQPPAAEPLATSLHA